MFKGFDSCIEQIVKIMKLVIDRKTWYRGKGSKDSRLLNNEGQKCCLGFLATACGIEDEKIFNTSKCDFLDFEDVEKFPRTICDKLGYDTALTMSLYEINDSYYFDNIQREKLLTEQFVEAGIEVEFIN